MNLPLQQDNIQKIAGNYDLTVTGFEPVQGGAANASYLLYTEQGNYVLTIFSIGLPRVLKLGRLLVLLAKYEFPTTRLLCPAREDIAMMYMDKPVMLKKYIAGQVCQGLDGAMLAQIGAAMATLHQVPVPDFLPAEHAYGLQFFPSVIGQNVNSEYESWLAKRLTYLKQRIPPELPRGLIHGDVFYDNVLFEGEKLKAIIDFEEACHYYKVFDLGMGILGLCAEGATVALDKASALLEGYQQIRLLEEREKETVQLFVEYAAIATSSWRFWKYHIYTPIAEMADRHLQMMRLAEEVSAIPKASFLEAVFD